MIAGSLLFGMMAMLSYGLMQVYSQPLAKRFEPARFIMLRGVVVCALLIAATAPTLYKLAGGWQAAIAAVAIGVFGYLPPLAFTHGIKVSRVSIVAPIAGTAPFITVLLAAVFLHMRLQGFQWVGIVLIVLANIAVSLNFRSLHDSNVLKLASGVPYGLIAAAGWGVVALLIVYPTRSLGPWAAALMMEIGVLAAAMAHVFFRREPFMLAQAATKPVAANAVLICIGTLAYAIGVKSFHVGIVAALANSTGVVAIVAATIIHGERLTRAEKILAVLMVLGVALISLA